MARIIARVLSGLTIALLALALAPIARADAPGTRGPDDDRPRGGTAQAEGNAAWEGVYRLPVPTAPQVRPLAEENGSWVDRTLNPGTWVLNSGMGVVAGVLTTLGESAQQSAGAMSGRDRSSPPTIEAVLPSSCADQSGYNIVFCTPPEMTYAHTNLGDIWAILRTVAQGAITLLFLVRTMRLLADGPSHVAFATEGKAMLFTFIGVTLVVQMTPTVLALLVDLFNGISNALLGYASRVLRQIPPPSGTEGAQLQISTAIMSLVFWAMMLWLMLKSMFRIAQIFVLMGVAPVAGALLIDRATAPRFHAWLNKLVELLFEQVAITLSLIVAFAVLQPMQGAGAGDAFVNFLMGSIALAMAAAGSPALTGIASAATQGGWLMSRIQMAGLKGVAKVGAKGVEAAAPLVARGGTAAAAATLGALGASGLSAGMRDRAFAQAAAGAMGGAASGAASAAAAASGRSASTPRLGHGRASFHLPEGDTPTHARLGAARTAMADVLAAERAEARAAGADYRTGDLHRRAVRDGDRLGAYSSEARLLGAMRTRAGINATGMQAQARAYERGGRPSEARQLRSKAYKQERFARGQPVPPAPRRTPEQTAAFRSAHREALVRAQAEHEAERMALKTSIGEARAALAEAAPAAQTELMAGILRSEARLAELTPDAGHTLAPATRQRAYRLAQAQVAAPAPRPSARGGAAPVRSGAAPVRSGAQRVGATTPSAVRAATRTTVRNNVSAGNRTLVPAPRRKPVVAPRPAPAPAAPRPMAAPAPAPAPTTPAVSEEPLISEERRAEIRAQLRRLREAEEERDG